MALTVLIDIKRDSTELDRLEIVETGRRRRFSKEMKLQIVAESYSEPGFCAATARRHDISRSQLYEWRRLARAWQFDLAGRTEGFVPAAIVPETSPTSKPASDGGRMEVVSALGRPLTIIVEVTTENERLDLIDEMKKRFASCPQVQQCYYVTGETDFILVMNASDMDEYTSLTRRLFFKGGNVKSFRTCVAMEKVKTDGPVPL